MKKRGTPKLQRNRTMRSTLGDVPIVVRSLVNIARLPTTQREGAKFTRRLNRKHGVATIPAQPTGLLLGLLKRVGLWGEPDNG